MQQDQVGFQSAVPEFGMSPPRPPQHPGELPAQQSAWPSVIGIIMIVLGSLGVAMYACGGVFTVLMPALMGAAASSGAQSDPILAAQTDVTQRYLVWNLVNSIVLLALGIMLLTAGIGLLRRRAWSVGLGRGWAIGRIAWTIPATYMGYRVAIETFAAMEKASQESGQPMPPFFGVMMQGGSIVGSAVGAIFVCALPVFVLIWFARGRVRSEVATWAGRNAASAEHLPYAQ